MPNLSTKINKLQMALNRKGCRLLVNRKQYYSDRYDNAMNLYIVSKSMYDAKSGRATTVELFTSSSQIQCLLFLKNLWDVVNGKEVIPSNLPDFDTKWELFTKQYSLDEIISCED